MCFGRPGLIVAWVDADKQVGRVQVSGSMRTIHCGLLEADAVLIGTRPLLHQSLPSLCLSWARHCLRSHGNDTGVMRPRWRDAG